MLAQKPSKVPPCILYALKLAKPSNIPHTLWLIFLKSLYKPRQALSPFSKDNTSPFLP